MSELKYKSGDWVNNERVEIGRRTGATTRLIDKAVQLLFTHGEIRILSREEIMGMKNALRGREPRVNEVSKMLIDPDWETRRAQENFSIRVRRRLQVEHEGCWRHVSPGHFVTEEFYQRQVKKLGFK